MTLTISVKVNSISYKWYCK